MTFHLIYLILLLNPVFSRTVPKFDELEEDEQHLFRAAYETPAYNHDEYEEPEDLPLGKLDLVKDGLWAVKAKLKELKAFDKAMAANLLSTKLQVKEMLKNHLGALKKHQHVEYHPPAYAPSYHAPHYAPAPQYGSEQQYGTPVVQYTPAAPQYAPPSPVYAPPPLFAPPAPQYAAPAPQYGGHDPYYGH